VVYHPKGFPSVRRERKLMSPEAKVHYLTRTTFDPDDSTAQAQAIIDAEMNKRMDLVHQLATIAAVDAARHAAIAAGWTETQLLELGLGAVENSKHSAGRRVARPESESSLGAALGADLAAELAS
jgi:hypothetical protein